MKQLLLLFLALVFLNANAQIVSGESAPYYAINWQTDAINLSVPNAILIQQEDNIEDYKKDVAWRFGIAIPVSFNLDNSGKWDTLANGSFVWTMAISSKKAVSLNFNFSYFELDRSSKLFLYNEENTDVLGAISFKNNKKDHLFSTRPIQGSKIFIELITDSRTGNNIQFESVVYGYRSVLDKAAKGFGSSGNCNNDVNCPIGDNWEIEKKAIGMVLTSNNTRFCSGALVNNVLQDSTPYFLTAAHCNVTGSSVFVFNYLSNACNSGVDGNLNNSISGSSLRAVHTNSDFRLVELSVNPADSFDVYFSAWSAINQSSALSTGIHHPSGDVMKISQNDDSLVSTDYYSTQGSNYWMVNNWESGTTEGGSSGSPLFNESHQIIGQLRGGEASCGKKAQDYYGKFSTSWNAFAQSNQQLMFWLDPNNSGATTLNGFYPRQLAENYNAALLYINGIENYSCNGNYTTEFIVRNEGNNPITDLTIEYSINQGALQTISWNGNLNSLETVKIPFSFINSVFGSNVLSANIRSTLNNNQTDSYLTNNGFTREYVLNNRQIPINIELKTDDYGSETYLNVKTASGFKLYDFGPYDDVTNGQVFNYNICLYDSCFSINLLDTWGDGFNTTTGTSNGYLVVTTANNDTLAFENNFTSGKKKTYTFCLSDSLVGIRTNKVNNSLKLYPNPVKRGEILTLENPKQEKMLVRIISLGGQEIQRNTSYGTVTIQSQIAKGIYFVEVRKTSGISIMKLLVD